ncbi:MAG: FecR domain-containing protein [Ekhidna sp.]
MNLKSNDIEREEVFYRYLRGELTPADKKEVDDWCSTSAKNQQVLDEFRVMFLDMKGLAYYKNISTDPEQSWEDFKKQNNVRSIKSGSTPGMWLKYAASILIVVSVAFATYYIQNEPNERVLASNADVQEMRLPDSSTVTLNKGASLTFQEPYQNNERRVRLTGDAHFDIAENPEQPFVVEAGEVEVRVLGTMFFIQQISEEQLNVIVEEGKVLVSFNEVHEIIEAGTSISIDLTKETLLPVEDETGVGTFWKNRKLVFNLTTIEEVVETVNRAYETQIDLQGTTDGCALTVTFNNESLENVLEIISNTLNYQVEESQDGYILKGDGCK